MIKNTVSKRIYALFVALTLMLTLVTAFAAYTPPIAPNTLTKVLNSTEAAAYGLAPADFTELKSYFLENTPAANIFTVAGTDKKFILLDENPEDDNSRYFILTYQGYGPRAFDIAYVDYQQDSTIFNPGSETNIAYWLNDSEEGFLSAKGNTEANLNGKPGSAAGYTLPQGIIDHINPNHIWWTEPYRRLSPTAAYSVQCGVSLMAQYEFVHYRQKFGVTDNYGYGYTTWTDASQQWWFRTSRADQVGLNMCAVRNSSQSDRITNSAPATDLHVVRPVFWLDKDFFKNVKLEVASMGSEIKKTLLANYTVDELYEVYGEELSDIAVTNLPTVPNAKADVLSNGNAYEIPTADFYEWKSKFMENTPAENVFTVDGTDKKFILLDENPYSNNSRYFILTYQGYGARIFDTSTYEADVHDPQKFDPDVETNIAHWLNDSETGFLSANGNGSQNGKVYKLPESVIEHIAPNHTWRTEPINRMSASYSVNTGVALMAQYEFVHYRDKFGIWDGVEGASYGYSYAAAASQLWWFRTSRGTQSNTTENMMLGALRPDVISSVNGDGKSTRMTNSATNGSGSSDLCVIRPVFWLDKDFFAEVKLDAYTMGDEIKETLLANYTNQELASIYSPAELAEIGFGRTDAKLYNLSVIKTVSGFDVSATVENNLLSETLPVTLVIAAYDEGGSWLLDMIVDEKTTLSGNEIYGFGGELPAETAKIKVFCLNSLSNLKPLAFFLETEVND